MTEIILSLLAAVLAITLHEAAHGYAALALGDDTAKSMGRLSLNPLRHVDRFGTILLPGFLVISQLLTLGRVAFLFGWAKPVPVAAWRFANPRRGMMIVAAAGPAMNFFLAWLGGLALFLQPMLSGGLAEMLAQFIYYFILVNLVLGLFNLLPIPPLDGGRIAVGLLPERLAMVWARMERAGILVVLLVVFLLPLLLQEFGIDFDPVRDGLGRVLPWAIRLVLQLSGHGGGG
ncbi:MAG TPA: site-2 protease family protein [Acetobacteraceae bacterium]|nr:site-2 protease family protein [Acetobacteraceae bacterium]